MPIGFQVTFDAADPAGLSEFWAEALGYILQPPPPGFATWDEFADSIDMPQEDRDGISAVVDPEGNGPRLLFLKVPEGKTAKNRVHLDINAAAGLHGDPEAAQKAIDDHVATLMALGASEIERHAGQTGNWVVMADPEGNEFCVQ